MEFLDNISDNCKIAIDRIIKGYNVSLSTIQANLEDKHNEIGIDFLSIFGRKDEFSGFSKMSDSLAIDICRKNPSNNVTTKELPMKDVDLSKIAIIEQLHFLMKLVEGGYVLMSEDKDVHSLHDWESQSKSKYSSNKQGFIYSTAFVYYDNLCQFIDKYYYARVIPTQTLLEYQKHDYQTPEQRRFRLTQWVSWIAVLVAVGGILIALFK